MNEEILGYIESVTDQQFLCEMETLDKLGEQLVKEYQLGSVMMITEASEAEKEEKYAHKSKKTISNEGKISTITKIGDWFKRIIIRIQSHFAKGHIKKTLEKIKNLPAYEQNKVFEGIMIDEKWYKDNIEESLNSFHNDFVPTFVTVSTESGGVNRQLKMGRVFGDARTRGDTITVELCRSTMNERQKLADSYKELNKLTAVNDGNVGTAGPFRHRRNVYKNDEDEVDQIIKAGGMNVQHPTDPERYTNTKDRNEIESRNAERGPARNLNSLLDHISAANDFISEDIKKLRESIPIVKQHAKDLMEQNVNDSERVRHRQNMYVHLVTDISRCLMYISFMLVKIVDWMRWTLGQEHDPTPMKAEV
jgi:hypothetical protein